MDSTVKAFIKLARSYVDLLKTMDKQPADDFRKNVTRLLPKLYSAGLELPDVNPDTDDVISSESINNRESEICQNVANVFGKWIFYWEVFDPFNDADTEAVCGSLADDLSETYAEIAEPLEAFDNKTAGMNDIVWSWKFAIQGHGGDHMVDAIRALQRLERDYSLDGDRDGWNDSTTQGSAG